MTKEQQMFDALKRITQYEPLERLERVCEKQYGLTYHEALEMAYDNMRIEAQQAIRGMRRPADPKVAL